MRSSPSAFFCIAVFAAAALAAGAQTAAPEPAGEGLYLRTALDVAAEYTYRSADEMVEPYQYNNGIDFTRNYLDMPPFIAYSVDLGRVRGLSLGFTVNLQRKFDSSLDGYFPSNNLPISSDGSFPISFNSISRGVLSWTSPALDLSIGRDKVDYGGILQGSIFPSDRLPYLDAFRARVRLGPLTFDYMISSQDAIESWDGNDVDINAGVTPGTTPYGWYDSADPTAIIETYHSLSWDFGRLSVRIAENMMLARSNNRFTVTDFLPIMFWHQGSVMPNNETFLWSVDWTPSSALALSLQGGFDAFNPNPIGIGDTDTPTIPAFVLGGKYRTATGFGAADLYFEAGYTQYLWGNFSAAGQGGINDADPLERCIYRYMLDSNGIAALIPLTSPYGPGALWFRLLAGQELGLSGLRIGTDILLLGKNTEANLIVTPYDQTVQNAPWEFFGQFGLNLRWQSGAFDLSVEPSACERDGTWWFESSFALAYHFKSATKIEGIK
ncbi:MAG: hypothetical protein ACLQMF_08725 [Rectinemataceae bacterium]